MFFFVFSWVKLCFFWKLVGAQSFLFSRGFHFLLYSMCLFLSILVFFFGSWLVPSFFLDLQLGVFYHHKTNKNTIGSPKPAQKPP